MAASFDLVSRLWRLCSLLRKDGVTYPQYVMELTYLLFLKIVSERPESKLALPPEITWTTLGATPDSALLDRYRDALATLGRIKEPRVVQSIFAGATTVVRSSETLRKLIEAIDSAEWYSETRDTFGDAYEGLLQKNADETKRGAGQYFTPRPLVDAMVQLVAPQPGEIVQDPAAGTGGFLIATSRAIAAQSARAPIEDFQRRSALRGVENVIDTYRMLCMNLFLHGIDADHVIMGDTLSPIGAEAPFQNANVILSNPPFGPSGGVPARSDLTVTARSSNFQLPFVEHCIRALAPGGRAAVIVPDNVLFEGGRATELRRLLMRECVLHTILRLPTGIFYAQGIRTNVLFFSRPPEPQAGDATTEVWIYDLRAERQSGPRGITELTGGLGAFIDAYGDDPLGQSERIDLGESGRFRRFMRSEISARNDDLYITWLKEEADLATGIENLPPDEVAAAVERNLVSALDEIRALIDELNDEDFASDVAP